MDIHASQRDAKHILSNILYDNINSEMITVEQMETLLKRVYKKEEATSFYKSAKHFIGSVNNINGQNTVDKLSCLLYPCCK